MIPPASAPALLHWDEPDIGCVACGEPYVTIDDHRCGTCLELPVHHCPLCLGDIAALIDREVVRRLRQASNDVNDAWVDGDFLRKYRDAERVTANRAAMRARWAS